MNYTLRHCGLPSISLWEWLLPNFKAPYCHEDNQAMIRMCMPGNNHTLRYLSRTMGISVAWLHERSMQGCLSLTFEVSENMTAYICTNICTGPDNGNMHASW